MNNGGSERAIDRMARLMREAATAETSADRIVVNGNGNILGNVTIHHAAPPARRRGDRRTIRVSAIAYIRSACRCAGDPTAWIEFTTTEFGTGDLDRLSDLQLERVRGWCAAREGRS